MATYSAYSNAVSATTWTAAETAIRHQTAGVNDTVAWYDFTDAATLTDDGGGLISKWEDKLGSGHDLVAAGTARPTLGVTGILFNGSTNFMKCTFDYNQPEYIYLVVKPITHGDGNTIIDGNADVSGFLSQYGASPLIRANAGTASVARDGLTIGAYGIIRCFYNGASSKLQVNAGAATTGNYGAANMDGITLFRFGTSNVLFANFEIKEGIFRMVADDAPTEALIYNYLKAKYGL